MNEAIKKHNFKRDADLQIEVVPLETLINTRKEHLITPHRTNFYHIFLLENCQPTHFVDFEPIKIEPFTILFIDKDRVHQFDQLTKYVGQVLVFTDDFFCTNEADARFLKSNILFNDLSTTTAITIDETNFGMFLTICQNIKEEC